MRNWHTPCIVVDVDRTLCPLRQPDQSYADVVPYPLMVERLQDYSRKGWYIIIQTARQQRTYEGNPGRIMAYMVPALIRWLEKNHIPYDEVWPNKPWCGFDGLHVDDAAVSPVAFLTEPWEALKNKIAISHDYLDDHS